MNKIKNIKINIINLLKKIISILLLFRLIIQKSY